MAVISVVLGAITGIAIPRHPSRVIRLSLEGMVFMLVIVPEVVLAVSLLLFYTRTGFELSFWTLVAAHTPFTIAIVAIIVRSRVVALNPVLEDAAADLGAGAWPTMRDVILPELRPALIACADPLLHVLVRRPRDLGVPHDADRQHAAGLSLRHAAHRLDARGVRGRLDDARLHARAAPARRPPVRAAVAPRRQARRHAVSAGLRRSAEEAARVLDEHLIDLRLRDAGREQRRQDRLEMCRKSSTSSSKIGFWTAGSQNVDASWERWMRSRVALGEQRRERAQPRLVGSRRRPC